MSGGFGIGTWNVLPDSAMAHVPLLMSRVGGGGLELVGVNAPSCSLLTRDEVLETLLICALPPAALLPPFALAAGSPCSSPASCLLITRHSA